MSVNADQIVSELDRLWVELGKQSGAEASQGVVRACALTLVVVCDEEDDPAAVGETLAELMKSNPNRAIVLQIRRNGPRTIEHRVTAQCWTPFGRREQICCEQIEITASAEARDELAPVLAAITAPDLPVIAWYRSAELLDWEVDGAQRRIVDSAGAADPLALLRRLAARPGVFADLAWTRLTHWREMLAQAFENPSVREMAPAVTAVRVAHAGTSPPTAAYYFAGWIEAAIGRAVNAEFDRVEGDPHCSIEGATLAAGAETISIRRADGPAVLIQAGPVVNCGMCPAANEAQLIAQELAISGRDEIFERALAAAIRIAERR